MAYGNAATQSILEKLLEEIILPYKYFIFSLSLIIAVLDFLKANISSLVSVFCWRQTT
jgi:hypothetical protein